jgi:RimJ/RimL family protein N-acetyltransferase
MTWLKTEVPRRIVIGDLELRCYEMTDAHYLGEAIVSSLPELEPWMPWAKFEPLTLSRRADLINGWRQDWDEGAEFVMGIFRNGNIVGSTGLHLRGTDGQLEIGYWVKSDACGEGIATRSTRALVETAFTLPEVQEVQILHDKANVKSRRVPEKLRFESRSEEARDPLSPGDVGIACLWSMTRERWVAL